MDWTGVAVAHETGHDRGGRTNLNLKVVDCQTKTTVALEAGKLVLGVQEDCLVRLNLYSCWNCLSAHSCCEAQGRGRGWLGLAWAWSRWGLQTWVGP